MRLDKFSKFCSTPSKGRLIVFLITAFCSQVYATQSPVFEESNHCQSYPRECLNEIAKRLPSIPEHSIDWFRLKQNQFTALFQLQKHDQLKSELPLLVKLDDAPPVFLTTAYTIHAKLLMIDGQVEEGRMYADKAVSLIKAVNEVSIDPTRYAEASNLYTYAKDWQAAKEFGLWAQSKIANIKNLAAIASFHTSQGHVYSHLGEHEQAEFHYTLALKGYLQKGNAIHCSVGYHNLARTFQKTGRHDQAIRHFVKAIGWSDRLGEDYDAIGKSHTLMRLTQSYIRNNQLEVAQFTFELVDYAILPEYYTATYKEVKNELVQAIKVS